MKRITDPTFKYTPAVSTDIRKTFARVRKEQESLRREVNEKVQPLIRSRA